MKEEVKSDDEDIKEMSKKKMKISKNMSKKIT